MKRCTKCCLEKPEADFNFRSRVTGARKPSCRECQRAEGLGYYEANRVRESARKAAAYLADPEKFKARNKAAYEKNPAAQYARSRVWIANNQVRYDAWVQQWQTANLPKLNEKSRRRRALKLDAMVVWIGPSDIDARMSVFGHRCAYCGGPFEEVDHVIPLSRGGKHILANLRPACTPCNRRKWAKPLGEWISQQPLT